MNVTFLAGTLGLGGAEKQLLLMLRALRLGGARCRVLCLTKDEPFERAIRDAGVEVEWIGPSRRRGVRLVKIASALSRKPADLIQSAHFFTNIYTGLAGRALGIPSIGAIRSDFSSEVAVHGLLGPLQVRLPRFLIANSERSRRRAIDHGIAPERIRFVRNAVEQPSPIDDDIAYPRTETVVLLAGRLEAPKRIDRFIRLAARLRDAFPSHALRFEIAGDGSRRAELEAIANEAGLAPPTLAFLGACASMDEVYGRASMVVSTSDFEGTPNVVLEAMAHGLPVVATDSGGVAEIVEEDRGLVVAPDDEDALFESAARLVANGPLRRRLGANGRRYVADSHSLHALGAALMNVYEEFGIAR